MSVAGGGRRKGSDPVGNLLAGLEKRAKDLHRSSFLMTLQKVMGAQVDVQLSDGRVYRGVFSAATPFVGKKYELVLKAVTALDASGKSIEDPAVQAGSTVLLAFSDIATMTISKANLKRLEAQEKELETDSALGQRTDIKNLEGRDLQSVATSWLAPETSTSLEENGSRGGIGQWNQFEANRRLYNVQDTYDENLYTKKLDKRNLTKEQLRKADRVARSIETSTSNNVVLKEDRGQLEGEDFNEEDMFSGVMREDPSGRRGGKSPRGPQGAWRRGLNLSSEKPSTAPKNTNNQSEVSSEGGGTSSPGGAWSSKAAKDSASALLASSVGVGVKSNTPSLVPAPPGLSKSERAPQDKKTQLESNETEPNISFFGTSEDEKRSDEEEGKSDKGSPVGEKVSVSEETTSEGAVEETSKAAGETKVESKSKLRADAAEWKPNPSAAEFVPSFVSSSTGNDKKSGKGGKGGNSFRGPKNSSRNPQQGNTMQPPFIVPAYGMPPNVPPVMGNGQMFFPPAPQGMPYAPQYYPAPSMNYDFYNSGPYAAQQHSQAMGMMQNAPAGGPQHNANDANANAS